VLRVDFNPDILSEVWLVVLESWDRLRVMFGEFDNLRSFNV
jgi:hypothetical protein